MKEWLEILALSMWLQYCSVNACSEKDISGTNSGNEVDKNQTEVLANTQENVKISQKTLTNMTKAEITNTFRETWDPVLEQCFPWIGTILLGDGRGFNGNPQCMEEPVSFKVSIKTLLKYQELKKYYDVKSSTVNTTMGELLRQICKGKGMQAETQDTIYECIQNNAKQIVLDIINSGMLKKYLGKNPAAEIPQFRTMLAWMEINDKNFTVEDLEKINTTKIPFLFLFDLYSHVFNSNPTINPEVIKKYIAKLNTYDLTDEEKQALVEMYAEKLHVDFSKWYPMEEFEKFMDKILPVDTSTIPDEMMNREFVVSLWMPESVVRRIENYIDDKNDKNYKKAKKLLARWLKATRTISRNQALKMTENQKTQS